MNEHSTDPNIMVYENSADVRAFMQKWVDACKVTPRNPDDPLFLVSCDSLSAEDIKEQTLTVHISLFFPRISST